ncbi:MAG: nickel/cobalt transporter [Bauldia sp.]|nr:nickel/cobalt transporter [Bauldia sp.]
MKHRRLALARAALAVAGIAVATAAAAQGPFGITMPEAGASPAAGGLFGPIFAQIGAWQTQFYSALTDALGAMRENGSAFFVLAGMSFLYGIFHAAGPGHGKAVISAYLLASGETLRRGVLIAFASAFVQALVAIILVSIAAGILRVTAVTMNEATRVLEIGSYALIVVVGLWLLVTRVRGPGHVHDHGIAAALPAGGSGGRRLATPIHAAGPLRAERVATRDDGRRTAHDHGAGGAAHLHAPDPALLRRPMTLRGAWTAILAVGIRPCSGALIVLVFAMAQGLYAAGIASTLVMAVGTALTVSLLASIAVLARDTAIRLTRGRSRRVAIALRAIEIAAAAAVLVFGALLLGGVLWA